MITLTSEHNYNEILMIYSRYVHLISFNAKGYTDLSYLNLSQPIKVELMWARLLPGGMVSLLVYDKKSLNELLIKSKLIWLSPNSQPVSYDTILENINVYEKNMSDAKMLKM